MPLSAQQIELYTSDPKKLFNTLGFKAIAPEIKSDYIDFMAELNEALVTIILPLIQSKPNNYILYTHYLIIDAEQKICVGGIGCFVEDEQETKAQIGYYIFNGYEGKGYAKQAVKQFCEFIFNNSTLETFFASIPNNHIASEKVILANRFKKIKSDEINTFALVKA